MFRTTLTSAIAALVISALTGCASSPLDGPGVHARSTERGLQLTFGPAFFDYDEAELGPESAREVERIARLLRQKPKRPVIIEGHADDIGSESYNLVLSMARANAVKQALIAEGIDGDRLNVLAMGETLPATYNATDAGRAQNRRVEVIIR